MLPMHKLAERLLKTIRKQGLLRAGDRVAVAVSGGGDSVALLLLLVDLRRELGIVLSVAHVNHKLRGNESDADEQFVAALAAQHRLEFLTRTAPVERKAGVESAARRLRYEFFRELAENRQITKVATAHTLDDQAETVLLRMFRGTGIRGLAGILPRLRLQGDGNFYGEVVRPLAALRRMELREYLSERGQSWREDSSNKDLGFLRNRVRHRLMPVIAEGFGEAAIEHLAELAEIARAEEELWSVSTQHPVSSTRQSPVESAASAAHAFVHSPAAGATLDIEELLALPLAAARRSVRDWIETYAPDTSISFRLIEEILELTRGSPGKQIELPSLAVGQRIGAEVGRPFVAPFRQILPSIIERGRKELVLVKSVAAVWDYEYGLPVPGEVSIPELGVRFVAQAVAVDSVPEQDREQLLDAGRLDSTIVIRNWRAGDRFWPAHNKEEKKLKELLNDKHVTGASKKLWPVAVCRGELVWVRGFVVAEKWRPQSVKAIWIREMGENR